MTCPLHITRPTTTLTSFDMAEKGQREMPKEFAPARHAAGPLSVDNAARRAGVVGRNVMRNGGGNSLGRAVH